MAKGGKTNAMMAKYGRNMAKIMNQRSGAKVKVSGAPIKKGG